MIKNINAKPILSIIQLSCSYYNQQINENIQFSPFSKYFIISIFCVYILNFAQRKQKKIFIQFKRDGIQFLQNQGIDAYKQTRVQKRVGRKVTSTNIYLKLLIKLYKFLARRTDSAFNKTVLRRLQQANKTRFPISVSRLVKQLATAKDKNQTLVIVGTVTDDIRLLTLPKLNVVALRFTEGARKRILAAGGKTWTFDQLAQKNPTGSGVLLLRGPRVREAQKYFGRGAGLPGSHTKPKVAHTERRGKGAR
ncbi:hypothetical protein pb186bvf_005609 [Paramecium bursaria]